MSVTEHVANVLRPWRDDRRFAIDGVAAPVVVGCSGGADSAALLALAADAGLAPVAVYVDHGLRPASGDDATRVRAIAAALGADTEVVRVDVASGGNLEARARTARHDALERARCRVGASVVMLGHTQDDQAETVLLNLLRGSGSAGLGGMASRRDTFVRPLLGLRRADTHAICAALEFDVARDPMNDDPAFRRVVIRRDVLPLLSSVAARDLVPVLARQSDVLREESQFLDRVAATAWPAEHGTDVASLCGMDPVLARRALRQWLGAPPPSHAEVQRVLDVARGRARATELAGGRCVRRSGGRLFVEAR
ncbi:MAG: tRNA lysidine(34) synthetase TilS [Acidimicrobiia bacterium]